jgi:hypothetical protein
MSSNKEPHFFSIESQWGKGVVFHNSLFDHCNKDVSIFGESSTTYWISEVAMRRISNSLHAPKIIIVIREPLSRTISHYKWLYAKGLENRSLLDAIQISGYGFNPNCSIQGNYMSYIEFSSYSKWVPRWQAEFGAENVLLINSEDLKHNTIEVLDKCAKLLGVESITWILPEEKNRTIDVAIRTENKISRKVKSLISKQVKKKLREQMPGLVGKWDDIFVRHIKRQTPHLTDKDISKVRALLSVEKDYFFELFKVADS